MFRFKTIFSMMLALALTVIIIPATVFAAEEDLVPGSTAPALSVGISNVTDIDAELTFEVTGYAGEYKIKYLVLKTSEDKPDVDTIKNTGNIAESNVAAITNLIPETAYTVYSIAYVNDANQILTGISTVQFITLNSKTSAVPVITNVSAELTDGGAALNFTVNKACMYYYLVYEKETATPDAQVIKAQGEAVAKGSGSVNANEASNVHITAEFDLSKTYTLYLVAEDEKGVFSEISMLALGLPIKMFGAGASDPVTINIETVTGNGTGYTYSGGTVTIIENGNYVITGSGTTTTNRIKVADSIEAMITLNNVNIDVSAQWLKCAFDITRATVILTLEGDNILKSGSYCAGLQASQGAMLTISADSTGTLTATGGDKSAGIGGADNSQYSDIRHNDSGNIIINGGTVNANGTNGAGIGGGNGGTGGNITITGGEVNANGGKYSAGIGSGYCKGCGTITIQGGIIHAVGGSSGPGIGCGLMGDGGNITISGGEVYANGGSNGMGIGASSGTVSVAISNGIVEAKGGPNGAGIGGGEKIGPTSKTGEVYITGGNITATGGDNAAGIGANYYSNSGKITIDGGTVNAIGNREAAGIGGAMDGRSPTDPIVINGGNIIATGGSAGAGIGAGGGDYSQCGDVTITGGQVTATGGMYAAGIGGGGGRYASTCGLVSISGPNTVVNAKGDISLKQITSKPLSKGHNKSDHSRMVKKTD
ncbi:hypothetical protein [Acetanaerobacterium elongatum]|uniref:Fibronectin type-III domain-containing protein n=1 Tax=Acetanaerobacterium elongatum TaxID=258515 RepID=A0A1H0FS42_9FIRM|nr:hypothetical protein [Acetanaerobacterium elongatum]SDN97476.1 hypothetical protein SAMN05192585_1432 [Acetanaerobacterium elongatum]